jgi:hypothetical protein
MATIGATYPTLTDVAKRMDPDGRVAKVAELLEQQNDMLLDIPWFEGNLPTGHQVTVRTGLPTVAWRLFNAGVQPSKSTTAQVTEGCGMLEAWNQIDKDLAMLNGNTAEYRLSEGVAFVEAMNQEMQSTFFYGNSSIAPEEMNGLSIRYSDPLATNGQNIIDAGGAGADNSSIWLIVWGQNTIHGIYPKGSKAGLMHEDLGLQTVENAGGVTGALMQAYRDHWQWKCGMALRDWRYAVRIGSIDISNLTSKTSAADLTELMIKAVHRIPNLRMGKAAFYMNRTLIQCLDIQRKDAVQAGGQLSYDVVDGKQLFSFRGIPIRMVDALTESETAV